MYTLHDYARMIADEGRIGPYVRALQHVVKPGSVVADIGTGTGIFALAACRLGAARVYAVDANPAVAVGRELARENGFSDRITFFQEDVRRVTLPERVDVVVSDLRGNLPLAEGHLAILVDVRQRFLKPGGVLVPALDRLIVGVVDSPGLHDWALGPATGPLGLGLESLRARLHHATCPDRSCHPITPAHILSETPTWATLDYATVQATTFTSRTSLRIERNGTGHGLALWFESVLADGIAYSTAPGRELSYGRLFLPWPRPVSLSTGNVVCLDLWAQADGDLWGWNTSLKESAPLPAQPLFKQSSFLSWPSKPTGRSSGESIAKEQKRGHSVGPT